MSGTPEKPVKSARKHPGPHGVADSNLQIALKLRALYSSVEQQPLPEAFLDLLEKLDRAEKQEESKS